MIFLYDIYVYLSVYVVFSGKISWKPNARSCGYFKLFKGREENIGCSQHARSGNIFWTLILLSPWAQLFWNGDSYFLSNHLQRMLVVPPSFQSLVMKRDHLWVNPFLCFLIEIIIKSFQSFFYRILSISSSLIFTGHTLVHGLAILVQEYSNHLLVEFLTTNWILLLSVHLSSGIDLTQKPSVSPDFQPYKSKLHHKQGFCLTETP